ncbi:binding partner of ACD11 1-like [Salvia splendens]|uniref:binding partner of ACD11 1-like n=1 Tax=Salvia splendens TaxID=180675 RepID=UPI001C252308|nr:binding partner of ACD11 1-like [Salvia splendens]
MTTKTVKVSNVSLGATEQDIQEFFSFTGVIQYVEMKSENERSQSAYVTFVDAQNAETAVLLSGATIVDQTVTISLEPNYTLPASAAAAAATASQGDNAGVGVAAAAQKAEDVVSGMVAKGFILGKDALNRAKSFDERHQLISTASATVASLDQKIGLSEKITVGATIVNDKVKEVDEKFQVSEKTKTAFAAAGQTVSSAGTAVMKNRYILTGATWVTGAFSRVQKAAEDVGQKTLDKVAEEEQGRNEAQGYTKLDITDSPDAASTTTNPTPTPSNQKPDSPKGLIL